MAIHDWSKAPPGVFHHFHGAWLFELAGQLNDGVLPPGYYALGEQVLGGVIPDVLTFEQRGQPRERPPAESTTREPAPTATLTASAEMPEIAPAARVLTVRQTGQDRVVAVLEIVSPGNKKEASEFGALIDKTVALLAKGIHVVVVDLHRPGPYDPHGIANVVWEKLGQPWLVADARHPLAVASFAAGRTVRVYLEPLAVGDALPDMPMFLAAGQHVRLPLERSYRSTFHRLPAHLRTAFDEDLPSR